MDGQTPEQFFESAVRFHRAGKFDEAAALYRKVLAHEPANASALQMLGVLASQLGKPDNAVALIRQAIQIDPDDASAHSNLGMVLAGCQRWMEAADALSRAIALRPDLADAHNNLGNVRKCQGRIDDAIGCYRQAASLRPDFPDAWTNLGVALWESGEPVNAVDCLRRFVLLRPNDPRGQLDLAGALRDSGKFDESISAAQAALSLRPGYEDAIFSIALTRLHKGDFANGWPDFEAFWDRRLGQAEYRAIARWNGEPLNGRTLLLHLNHGFGDTLQLIRYAPMIAEAGGRVILRCQRELVRLLSTVKGIDAVFDQKDSLPAADLQCSLMSMPKIFQTRLETIPSSVPYVRPRPARVQFWKHRIAREGPCRNVGLNWAGSPLFREDRFRSMQLRTLGALAGIEGIQFYSLQKGAAAEQLQDAPAGLKIIDWTAELYDFADTAALMASLDLVVSSDTSVVHLAGALARSIWVLLHFVPGCFWLMDRADSPWYPTMRLFRQIRPNDWTDPVGQLSASLQKWAAD